MTPTSCATRSLLILTLLTLALLTLTLLTPCFPQDSVVAFVIIIIINVKATLNKQKRRMVPLYRKTEWDALKNICRLCLAFYYL